jgi:hypothetical protein
MEDPVRYSCICHELYLYLPYLEDLIIYLSSKLPRFDASGPECPGQVGRLMEVPLFLFTKSRKHGTPSTRLRQRPPSAPSDLE